jgi:YidC/Oxa1 family membrane protein insertase
MKYLNKKVLLSMMMVALMIVLAGCTTQDDGVLRVYDLPIWGNQIEAPLGVQWFQSIVSWLGFIVEWLSLNIGGGHFWIGLVILTIIIRLAGWPIYSKSNAMTVNMQRANPELEALKEKYRDKPDEASQKKMQAEQLEIYRKYNINPLGCLLPFLQMPIFISMYQVVRRMPIALFGVAGVADYVVTDLGVSSSDLYLIPDYRNSLDFSFLWIKDLGGADPYYILPVLVGLVMFFYQRYSTKKPDYLNNKKYQNKQQNQMAGQTKMMSYFMVFLLVSIALTNAGIALYWIIGNGVQFGQTYLTRRKMNKEFEAQKQDPVVKSYSLK